MLLNNPVTYMQLRGHPPTVILECAVCPTVFQAKDGVAFPAKSRTGAPIMAAFRCNECYLRAMPVQSLRRA